MLHAQVRRAGRDRQVVDPAAGDAELLIERVEPWPSAAGRRAVVEAALDEEQRPREVVPVRLVQGWREKRSMPSGPAHGCTRPDRPAIAPSAGTPNATTAKCDGSTPSTLRL